MLLDSIFSLSNASITVTRRDEGTWSKGVYTQNPNTTTFAVTVAMEPATGMQRVVPGRDMLSDEQGEHVTDVRVLYTATELKARTPTNDADIVTYDNSTWTIFRVEQWALNEQIYWRAVMTRNTGGAS